MPAYISDYSEKLNEYWLDGVDTWLDCNESQTWILSDEELDDTSYPAPAGLYCGQMSQSDNTGGWVVFLDHEVEDVNIESLTRLLQELNIEFTPSPFAAPEELEEQMVELLFKHNYVTIG